MTMMRNQMTIRTYSELMKLKTFEERFNYLRLYGRVGEETFGFDRYLNQMFYTSGEWRSLRNYIITRDGGCDLAIPDRKIQDQRILIHHLNPISKEDILQNTKFLLDPEFLITTIKNTHDAIHYSNSDILYQEPVARRKNDTCPWRH